MREENKNNKLINKLKSIIMKKIILSALALLLVGGACCANAQEKTKEQLKAEAAAQKAALKELKGYLKEAKKNAQVGEGSTPNFDAARAAIASAAKMPIAEGNVEFYLQAAEVEQNAFNIAAMQQNYLEYAKSASAGFDYFKKAYVAANGNKAQITTAQAGALNLYQSTSGLSMIGNVYYQEKQFDKCLAAFQVAKTAHLEPVLLSNPLAKPIIELNSADSTINNLYLNCFSVAQYMLMDTIAANKELVYLKDHASDDMQLNQVLQALALNYYGMDDSIHFEKALREGVERLPQESWYVNNLINIYINAHRYAEAGQFLDKAIANEPNSAMLINVKGNLLEQQGDMEGALAAYEKALAIDPTDAQVNSNIGRYYYNKAQLIEDEYYNKKQFDAGDKAATVFYDKALPYYEKAYAFDSERKDKTIAVALRMLYGKKIAKGDKTLQSVRDEVSAAYGF